MSNSEKEILPKPITFRPSKQHKNIIAQLVALAAKENRTLNNYIETLFINHIKEQKIKTNEIQ